MDEHLTRTPRTVLITATIALGGFVMGALSIAGFMEGLHVALSVGACTALVSVALAEMSLRASHRPALSAFLCIGLGYLFGTLNTAISFIVVTLIEGREELSSVLAMSVLAGLFGFVTGGPLGVAISTAYAILIFLTHGLVRDRSHETLDQLLVRCGAWLAGVGALGLLVAFEVRSLGGHFTESFPVLAPLSCALNLMGAVIFAGAFWRIGWRRRWLEKIHQGLVAGWDLVPLEELNGEVRTLRPLLHSPTPPSKALVRRSTGLGRGAYRTGELLEPVALV